MATKQEILEMVESAIEALLNNAPVQEYQIGNRNFKYMSLAELQSFRRELIAEGAGQTGTRTRSTYVRFNRPV